MVTRVHSKIKFPSYTPEPFNVRIGGEPCVDTCIGRDTCSPYRGSYLIRAVVRGSCGVRCDLTEFGEHATRMAPP